jgi:hypothetical protein
MTENEIAHLEVTGLENISRAYRMLCHSAEAFDYTRQTGREYAEEAHEEYAEPYTEMRHEASELGMTLEEYWAWCAENLADCAGNAAEEAAREAFLLFPWLR